jgi:ammonium transporter, Amt family
VLDGRVGAAVEVTHVSVLQPWAAIIIGLVAGIIYVFASKLVANVMKIDDPLDAVAVHAFCGLWGLIAAALFASKTPLAAAYVIDHDHYGACPSRCTRCCCSPIHE